MKFLSRSILIAALLLPAFKAQAQVPEKIYIIANADLGFGNAMNARYALPGVDSKSTSSDYGVAFGWTFWHRGKHSFEANVGVSYGTTTLKSSVHELDYHYDAPATADMDNDTYIRYYELRDLHQKFTVNRLDVPIYITYLYEVNDRFSFHALGGMKPGFKVSSRVDDSGVKVFSYGIYPQYDDLMIDASYMNEFGESTLGCDDTLSPRANSTNFSLLAGAGGEARIWGPVSAGVTFKYEGGLKKIFKAAPASVVAFGAENAPVTYTVAQGQKLNPLTNYLTSSRLSRLSLSIYLRYTF